MPVYTPAEIHRAFTDAFNAGDLDALLALYEPEAAVVPQPGQMVSGLAAIREVLAAFLALRGTIAMTTRTVITVGELASLNAEWTIDGTGPDGSSVALAGRTCEVARRQGDGTWRYVID